MGLTWKIFNGLAEKLLTGGGVCPGPIKVGPVSYNLKNYALNIKTYMTTGQVYGFLKILKIHEKKTVNAQKNILLFYRRENAEILGNNNKLKKKMDAKRP